MAAAAANGKSSPVKNGAGTRGKPIKCKGAVACSCFSLLNFCSSFVFALLRRRRLDLLPTQGKSWLAEHGCRARAAAVAWGPGEPLAMEEVEVAPPGRLEVRVKVLFTSVCHTDLSAWKGEVRIQTSALYSWYIYSRIVAQQLIFHLINYLFIHSCFEDSSYLPVI